MVHMSERKAKEVQMAWWLGLWDLLYLGRAPWDIGGPRPELVHLVETGELEPSRAIDLGCGIGENVIYLAKQGFNATGVDVSSRAIAKARRKARASRVSTTFFQGDVTDLAKINGTFSLVVDNGCLHSLLGNRAREAYVGTVLRLTRPGSRYFLRCFEKDPRRRFLSMNALVKPGEVEHRFGRWFTIETLPALPPGGWRCIDAVYLMRRRDDES
jgi:SAM-dependent methyltransferase